MAHRRLLTSTLTFTLATCLAAQCPDPPAGSKGFAEQIVADAAIALSDGYQTRADVVYPTTAPGVCGWPMVVAVHGLSNTKASVLTSNRGLARQGFFAVGYDVRGHGSTMALNPGQGAKLSSLDEWIDLFEIIEWAIATYPGVVDPDRIAVVGCSQGGMHAWAAAAWAGRAPPPNARRSAAFPVIQAAVPECFVPHLHETRNLDGTAFGASWPVWAYGPPPTTAMDPGLMATLAGYLDNDDPEGLDGWMRNDPGREFSAELAQSQVPVLAILSWLDQWMGPEQAIAAVESMPATTPTRIVLTTGSHGSTRNDYLNQLHLQLRLNWLRRFLKGWAEPIENGPPVWSAALPADAGTYLDPSSLWRPRADLSFPPADAITTTYYLRAGNVLSSQAPTAVTPRDPIRHRMTTPGYNARSWFQDGSGGTGTGGGMATALAEMPLSEVAYLTAPLAQDTEIAGQPILRLEVMPSASKFLVAARLDVVAPGGSHQILSHGGLGQRQLGAPTPTRLDIEMSAIDCVVPAGSQLRLLVRNHYIVKPSSDEFFRFMPYFNNYEVGIRHEPGAASALDLPVRPDVRLDMTTPTMIQPLTTLPRVDFTLRSSTAWQGFPYIALVSVSGQGPPVLLPNSDPLFLIPDALQSVFASAAGTPLLPGFVGVLDGAGDASAAMDLSALAPLPPALFGLNMHLAPVALNGTSLRTGAPIFLTFQ